MKLDATRQCLHHRKLNKSYYLSFLTASGPSEEDELYESHIVETNMSYHLENNKLVPVEDAWGNSPKYEMLKQDQVNSGDKKTHIVKFGSNRLDSLVVECWLRVREVPGSIPSQGLLQILTLSRELRQAKKTNGNNL